MISIVLADDHPLTRAGLAAMIAEEDGLTLLGEASDGKQAWDMIQNLKPDVALLDIRMPEMDGITVTRKVKEAKLPTKVIMLTACENTVAIAAPSAPIFNPATSTRSRITLVMQAISTKYKGRLLSPMPRITALNTL